MYKWDWNRTHAEQLEEIKRDNEEWREKYLPALRADQLAKNERRKRARGLFNRLVVDLSADDQELIRHYVNL